MTALADLLAGFRAAAVSEREKGSYFEELIVAYLRHEASYRDLYSDVWTYGDWAKSQGLTDKDSGIVNDTNAWAIETMKNPKYPLELLLRVIALSLETLKLIEQLPKLDVLET